MQHGVDAISPQVQKDIQLLPYMALNVYDLEMKVYTL